MNQAAGGGGGASWNPGVEWRDFDFFGRHVYGDVGEERRGEVAFAGIGEHAEDGGAFGGFGGDAKSGEESGAGGDADEDAFFAGEFAAARDGVGVGNADELADDFYVDGVAGEFGDEVRAPTLLGMRLPGGMAGGGGSIGIAGLLDAARQHRSVIGFADDDFSVGALFGEDAGDAFEGSSGAEAGDPVVEALAGEIVEDLAGGGAGVHVGVGFVFKLLGVEPAVLFSEFDGFGDHAGAAQRARG